MWPIPKRWRLGTSSATIKVPPGQVTRLISRSAEAWSRK